MNLHKQLRRLRRELARQAAYHSQALSCLPEGKIAVIKNGNHTRWLFRTDTQSSGGVPIYRKDKSFAQDLALKWMHQQALDTLSSQIRLLDQFAEQAAGVLSSSPASALMLASAAEYEKAQLEMIRYANQRVYGNQPQQIRNLAVPPAAQAGSKPQTPQDSSSADVQAAVQNIKASIMIKECRKITASYFQTTGSWYTSWLRQPYKRYMRRPEELRIQAKCGLLVRSKSEAIIADLLFEAHIPFHYEECLMVGNTEVYPDFTILIAPDTVVYWEHFGALKRADYLADTQRKMSSYLAGGIYPGRDLYITCEDSDRPLQLQEAEEIMLLISRRYMSSAPFSAEGDAPLRL